MLLHLFRKHAGSRIIEAFYCAVKTRAGEGGLMDGLGLGQKSSRNALAVLLDLDVVVRVERAHGIRKDASSRPGWNGKSRWPVVYRFSDWVIDLLRASPKDRFKKRGPRGRKLSVSSREEMTDFAKAKDSLRVLRTVPAREPRVALPPGALRGLFDPRQEPETTKPPRPAEGFQLSAAALRIFNRR